MHTVNLHDLKMRAKVLSKEHKAAGKTESTHQTCLEELARKAGFESYNAAKAAIDNENLSNRAAKQLEKFVGILEESAKKLDEMMFSTRVGTYTNILKIRLTAEKTYDECMQLSGALEDKIRETWKDNPEFSLALDLERDLKILPKP